MTSFILRIIAIIAMLLDHTAAVLVRPGCDEYILMRSIGRIAFPIFCFLIAEGFEHTRSVGKYLGRLALFAVLAEIPFDLVFHSSILELRRGQNVFVTLFLGLTAITAAGKGVPWLIKQLNPNAEHTDNRWLQLIISSPVIVLCCVIADSLSTDYGWFGVLLICIFYFLRSHRALALIAFALLNSFKYCIVISPEQASNALFAFRVFGTKAIQWFAPLAALPIGLYNGKPGSRKFRTLFYVFYPAHLLVLWVLSMIIK